LFESSYGWMDGFQVAKLCQDQTIQCPLPLDIHAL
jgi:hypothetical protein